MSRPNSQFLIPPGDRDELPLMSPGVSTEARPLAGRDTQPGAVSEELLPGLSLVIEQIGPALDEAQMALGDLKLAHTQGNLALMKSTARRLSSLTHHVSRTVKHFRPRESLLQPKE